MTKTPTLTRATTKIVITPLEAEEGEPPRYLANLRHRDASDAPANLKPCRHSKGHANNGEAVACGELMWGKLR